MQLVTTLIIYMKKLLDSDWLRAVQFKCNDENFCAEASNEKKMASRKIFRHFLRWELYSASCRLRLQIYELFNELTS